MITMPEEMITVTSKKNPKIVPVVTNYSHYDPKSIPKQYVRKKKSGKLRTLRTNFTVLSVRCVNVHVVWCCRLVLLFGVVCCVNVHVVLCCVSRWLLAFGVVWCASCVWVEMVVCL